jgi:hypothetical protein
VSLIKDHREDTKGHEGRKEEQNQYKTFLLRDLRVSSRLRGDHGDDCGNRGERSFSRIEARAR